MWSFDWILSRPRVHSNTHSSVRSAECTSKSAPARVTPAEAAPVHNCNQSAFNAPVANEKTCLLKPVQTCILGKNVVIFSSTFLAANLCSCVTSCVSRLPVFPSGSLTAPFGSRLSAWTRTLTPPSSSRPHVCLSDLRACFGPLGLPHLAQHLRVTLFRQPRHKSKKKKTSGTTQIDYLAHHPDLWRIHNLSMMTSSLPFLVDHDRLKLRVEKKMRNIFITQPDDIRPREENVNYIPIVTEDPSRILKAGVNTLQKTLVLKKQAELEEVNNLLALKRDEFKRNVEALSKRRTELETKHQETKEKAMKFVEFVNANEAKRSRALQEYKAVWEQNLVKQKETEELTKQLQQLQARRHILKDRITKHKIYEDYLLKTSDYLPNNHLERDSDCAVTPVIQRHETLSVTHQQLLQRLGHVEEEVELHRRQLHAMKQGHSMHKLMASKEIYELQRQLESLKEKNKQEEDKLLMEQGQSRKKAEEVGSLILAVNNLAEQCYLPSYGPLESMNASTMMDMVKEYFADKADTEKRARRLMMECGSQATIKTALTDKRARVSLHSFGSKSQIKSPSKVIRSQESC
ncbi:uncharacterized protein CCDC197 [Nerophis lumbriciformis]|uniref:uncharacterized protein CCDC197 n=1 Tax=Nerophis lumbriciformis TaxID=546530 RepID=UPI003BA9FF91